MANPKKYLVDVDFCQNEVKNIVLENLATEPVSPVNGQGYFDTVLGEARFWNGTEWVSSGGGSRGIDPDEVESPVQVTTDLVDYNPSGFTCETQVLCIDLDNNHELRGLQYQCDWQTVIISNDSVKDLKIKKEHASSLPANRFTVDADVTIKSGQAVEVFYNANKSRWFVLGSNF